MATIKNYSLVIGAIPHYDTFKTNQFDVNQIYDILRRKHLTEWLVQYLLFLIYLVLLITLTTLQNASSGKLCCLWKLYAVLCPNWGDNLHIFMDHSPYGEGMIKNSAEPQLIKTASHQDFN